MRFPCLRGWILSGATWVLAACGGGGGAEDLLGSRLLTSDFDSPTDADRDPTETTADWGATEPGTLEGVGITSRRVYVSGYRFADQYAGGQYTPMVDPLMGAAINPIVPGIQPPTSLGRRKLWAFSDSEIGPDGSVTVVSWGPDSNATFEATYPRAILRIGFQNTASLNLGPSFTGNYQGTPLVVYDGLYQVSQRANVGNLFPAPTNQSGFTQEDPLYAYTGFADWPPLTSYFEWREGDPSVAGDSVLLLDASVQEGDTWQQLRGWYATTAPGSGTLIAGFPRRSLLSTFEADTPNPTDDGSSVFNPEPTVTDTAFTITRLVSRAQSRFYTPDPTDPGGISHPPPYSAVRTLGVRSDYQPAVVTPAVQVGGTSILLEFQGAMALEAGSDRTRIDTAAPSTPWTTDVNECDGYPYVRWRMTLTSNLVTNQVARVTKVVLEVAPLPAPP